MRNVDLCRIWFSGSKENLIQNEFSPLLLHAVRNDVVIPYVLFTVIFYFFASYLALKILSSDEKLFYCISAILALISLAYTFVGLSWYFKTEAYSSAILALSVYGHDGNILIGMDFFEKKEYV